jgi:hypothetical protein
MLYKRFYNDIKLFIYYVCLNLSLIHYAQARQIRIQVQR